MQFKREHRKSIRRTVYQRTWIVDDQGTSLNDCVMLDVSAGGAQLRLKSADAMPDRFDLLFTSNGETRRHCEVIWRSLNTMGVRFLLK